MPDISSFHHQEGQFLLLGDSLVAGFNWQKRIPQFTIRNCGVPGATTRDLLELLPTLKSRFNTAQLILLMIGTNDIVQNNHAFIEDFREIVISLSRHYPSAELLVNSLLPMQLSHLSGSTVEKLNNSIQVICRETGSCYVDVYSKFLQADGILFQPDGVHITNAGYEIWARTVIEHIAFLVEND
jgi:lysophospholipase L1-like esterase